MLSNRVHPLQARAHLTASAGLSIISPFRENTALPGVAIPVSEQRLNLVEWINIPAHYPGVCRSRRYIVEIEEFHRRRHGECRVVPGRAVPMQRIIGPGAQDPHLVRCRHGDRLGGSIVGGGYGCPASPTPAQDTSGA